MYSASSTGTITQISNRDKGGFEVTIEAADGAKVVDVVPSGPTLIISKGDTIKADQPLTNNPNVGGFGQADAEVVLQDPTRLTGLILFFGSVVIAQIFLVLKKKQFEKVQLAEMNF